MDKTHTTRGASALSYHIVPAGNFQTACDTLLTFILDNELYREQIISISANETTTEDADAVLVLVYKTDKEPTMVQKLTDTLKYHLVKSTASWEDQYKELETIIQSNCDVISLVHTPRNIGQINIQILWYLPAATTTQYTIKYFKEDGVVDNAIEQAAVYLNKFVTPHNLVSISIFEEDHPSKKQFFNLVIFHRGDGLTPFNRPAEITEDIYQFKTLESYQGWEQLLQNAVNDATDKGYPDFRFLATTYNVTDGDQQFTTLLYWRKVNEDALCDQTRGGCCIIF